MENLKERIRHEIKIWLKTHDANIKDLVDPIHALVSQQIESLESKYKKIIREYIEENTRLDRVAEEVHTINSGLKLQIESLEKQVKELTHDNKHKYWTYERETFIKQIESQKAENEKQSELLKECYDVITRNGIAGDLPYRLKQYKNLPSLRAEVERLTHERNQIPQWAKDLLSSLEDKLQRRDEEIYKMENKIRSLESQLAKLKDKTI